MSTKRAPIVDWTGQTLFGKWTAERLIGVGGTSTVLQARHRNGRRAALKILHPHLAAHPRTRERFLREGRLANLVNHPGVVAVLDDFTMDDGTAVLVLELVQGKTLATLAKESGGLLTPHEVVSAAAAVLEVLAVAHDANVIHRDIKPENVLRRPDGSYKLVDFGLAALGHELGVLTGTDTTLGTPAYMSPEQARGDAQKVDARTDIWGLGASMFTLLTGRFLHAASLPRNLVVAAATEAAPPILSVEPSVHPPLAAIIDRALQMDKEQRWPNARAMLAELRTLELPASEDPPLGATSVDGAASMETAPSSVMSWSHAGSLLRRVERRPRWQLIGALIGVGSLLVGAVVMLTRATAAPASNGDAASQAEARHETATRKAEAAARTAEAAVDTPPAAVPVKSPDQQAPEAPVEIPAPARRSQAGGKARALSKATPEPLPSSPPRVASTVTEADLSIPDDVLDRRD